MRKRSSRTGSHRTWRTIGDAATGAGGAVATGAGDIANVNGAGGASSCDEKRKLDDGARTLPNVHDTGGVADGIAARRKPRMSKKENLLPSPSPSYM